MRRLAGKYVLLFLVIACAWAAFLRLWNLGHRPFWRDEAWVAMALRDLPFAQLWAQTALPLPPLFAVMAKSAGQWVGPPEAGYRLPAAIFGLAVIPLTYAAARRLRAPRSVALAAAGLCASSLMLVIWSRELKQYSFEAVASALGALLVFAARRAISGRKRCAIAIGLAVLGLIAPWIAHGSVFSLAAVLPLLLILKPRTGRRWQSLGIGLAGAAGLTSGLLGVWLFSAGAQSSEPSLARWTQTFYIRPLEARSWVRAGGYAVSTTHMYLLPAEWCIPVLDAAGATVLLASAVGMWLLIVVGVLAWPRQGRIELCAWVFGPWLLMLAAALAQRYPFAYPRMMLGSAPPALVASVAGAIVLARAVCRVLSGRGAPALIAGMFVGLLPLHVIQEPLGDRYGVHHDFRSALHTLDQQRRPGEAVLVTLEAVPCVRYYAPQLSPPVFAVPTSIGTIPERGTDYVGFMKQSAQRAGRRFWLLATSESAGVVQERSIQAICDLHYNVRAVGAWGGKCPVTGTAQLLLAERR
jgi:hypothetical protein